MRKILASIILLCLVFTLASCGEKEHTPVGPAPQQQDPAPAPAPIDVPKEYSRCVCKVIPFTIEEEKKPKYDFSDLVGKLHWQGDAVKEQRKMRDEW